MPGLVGFSGFNYDNEKKREIISGMQDLISYNERCVKSGVFTDGDLSCARVHIGIINTEAQPLIANGIYVWLDGEFYNQEDILRKEGIEAITDADILLECYLKYSNFDFLDGIDGIYAAVVYDSKEKKVYLFSDRYGFRYMFWTVNNGCLAWGSEVKAMLGLPDFQPRIDLQSVKEFINIGFLLETRTWFDNVSLLPTATILTWDMSKKTVDMKRYWWWDRIEPYRGEINEEELVKRAGKLLVRAVEKRCKGPGKVGVPLSGGLDSRAILAALPDCGYTPETVTIGETGSIEIPIAEKVARIKGSNHHVFYIDSDNWLKYRLEGVWQTDGHKNLYHMHLVESQMTMMAELFDIMLDGFGTYGISGGNLSKSSLNIKKTEFDVPIDRKTIASSYNCDEDLVGNIDEYSKLKRIDFYFIQNGDRRFSYEGTRVVNGSIHSRIPFFDNDFFEFCLSLPEPFIYNWRFYKKVLLNTFPNYYKDIPWTRTGMPISYSGIIEFIFKAKGKIKKELDKALHRIGFRHPIGGGICNYPELIKQAPARQFFEKLLFNPEALYKDYISEATVLDDWEMLLSGVNTSEKLCRYLTFEIWLQQIYNNKYKRWEEV